jgi:hypothetical protein
LKRNAAVILGACNSFPEFLANYDLVYQELVPPGMNAVSLFYGSFAEVVPFSLKKAARQMAESGSCNTITRGAIHRLLCSSSSPVITQTSQSPNLAQSHFRLVPTLKMGLKGTSVAFMEEMKSNVTAELRNFLEETFRRCLTMAGTIEQVCMC